MALVPPPGLTVAAFERALRAFASVVGDEWVFATDEDRATYSDHFAIDEEAHRPGAAVAPITVEEIQAIVRLANEHKVPLWPISRGKNFGYGGAAPRLRGSVVLDLSRMKKIEVDVENGTALVEPGVGFYDLYDYIQRNKIPLWLSVPGNSWGSVCGNALDRGVGYTTYGDHTSKICGLEVVLPDGDLVRTGMGAMSNAPTWQLYRYGYGPAWDQMFVQSNFGIVTKLGLWMMREPETMVGIDMEFDKPDDLEWIVDTVAPLRREGILQQSPSIGSWLRGAAVLTTRAEWYDKPGALPDSVIDAIRRKFNMGWWSLSMRFYGPEEITEATAKVVRRAFNGRPVLSIKDSKWKQGDPPELSAWAGVPITFPLQNANWHGGRGGHIGFSPVLPANGRLALEQFHRTYARYKEFGMDYHGSFAMGERHITNVNQVLFNKDDPEMMARVDRFFRTLVEDAKKYGYGEYRTHLDYMDLVAWTYDFNDRALLRLNEKVKNALDPNGILAPGKSGIWPARYAEHRDVGGKA
ncbi:MAG: FAD-binding oxidoreductase [Pseudomonadota bacterium]|jgi:FAD/FMN-containing dehydrogenases|nr:MAG: FAD-binding oxidoreductase [Pseudomonadota bacterium]